jgi:cysteine synthase A
VVSGAGQWLARHGGRELTAVAIAPDLGERYLDTVYREGWPADVTEAEVPAALAGLA